MPKFSLRSIQRLEECHPDLINLFNRVVERFDCTVVCGYRNEKEQNEAFDKGFSKVQFPNSAHNLNPALACDVVPYPVDWKDIERFKRFGYFVLGVAHGLDIQVKWGADWDMDMDMSDESFLDFPHFEIVKDA